MLSTAEANDLKRAFQCWPERLNSYGHAETEPSFTYRLQEDGAHLLKRLNDGSINVSRIRDFLIDVASWKMPGKRHIFTEYVDRNDSDLIQDVFDQLRSAGDDRERITACTKLHGFGRHTGQTRMASAILRFLWPRDYGVIDWRNYAVLSNCDHQFFSKALISPLASDLRTIKYDVTYDCEVYLTYSGVLRNLKPKICLDQAADVDLAIYSLSIMQWPFRPRSVESEWLFEAHWPKWEQLKKLPSAKQRDEKIGFLRMIGELIPSETMVFDNATKMRLPYPVVYDRNLNRLVQKIENFPPDKAVETLDSFLYNMRLKGEGLRVL